MPTYPRKSTTAGIERKIKEGRGSGEGNKYKPWLYTHEVASKGLSHNPFSQTTQRVMHFLSEGELKLFYLAEYAQSVVDIREQYPVLPREETVEMAAKHGIAHPMDSKTREPVVVTLDLLLTLHVNGVVEFHAWSFKYSAPLQRDRRVANNNSLENSRVLEKLELERLICEDHEIRWRIFTERDIPEGLYRNIKQFYSHFVFDFGLDADVTRALAKALTARVSDESLPLRVVCAECDRRFGLPDEQGISLAMAWHLLARRAWEIEYSALIQLIDPSRPLTLRTSNLGRLGP